MLVLGNVLNEVLNSVLFNYEAEMLLLDTFTDTNSTLITSHTSDSNNTWVLQSGTTGSHAIIVNNRVYGQASTNVYRSSFVQPSADYQVYGKFDIVGSPATWGAGITGRATADNTATFYCVRYDSVARNWLLFKSVSGVVTTLATWAETFNSGSRYITLRMQGSSIKGFINGVERLSATDATITEAGSAGLRLSIISSLTAGLHVDFIQTSELQ